MNIIEKILFRKVELWLVILLLLTGLVGTTLFGWAVRNALTNGKDASFLEKLAVELASIPTSLKILYEKGIGIEVGKLTQKNTQILKHKNDGNLKRIDETFNEDGILLVSAYSKENSISTVYLYDLRDKQKLWEWVPAPEKIIEKAPLFSQLIAQKNNDELEKMQTRMAYRAQHPYLFADGSIALTSGDGPLTKINACGEIVWVIDRQFHHSIEGDGGNLIVPIVSNVNDDNAVGKDFRDDGYAVVSMDGQIAKEESIINILKRGGYEGLLFGQTVRGDRVHLNDAEVIASSDAYVKAGDIMFSARNISTVFLYRPSNAKIVWLETGPWLSQHDIDYLGNGRFSIFGNDVDASGGDYLGRNNSNIYVYNMKDNSVSRPYDKVFRDNKLTSHTQGVQRILGNGDVFFEMSNSGELYRASPGKLRWSYVHSINNSEIGATHWSRYFNRNEIGLDWIKSMKCDQAKRGA